MSQGNFVISIYVTDNGDKVPIKTQPETLAATIGGAANASGAAPVTKGFPSADVSRSKKSIGIHARTVSLRFTATAPAGYAANSILRIPVLTRTLWDDAGKGTVVSYLGVAGVVAGRSPEIIV